MVNYNDPASLEAEARKYRSWAEDKQETMAARRQHGEKPSEQDERQLRRLQREAAEYEETAQRMRFGPSATHENQSSLNEQAKRYRT
jgi:hypothetical protein